MNEADRIALKARLRAAVLPHNWRTRFAPAPTGHLHLGHAVNAVYVWSLARAFGGTVIVRIEDHDRQRSRAVFEASIRDDLAWLGLVPDNTALGLPSMLRQSDDIDISCGNALQTLSTAGLVYACRCSRREIASGQESFGELRYGGICRNAAVADAATPARRVMLADTPVAFDDLRHGTQVQLPALQCGDLLLRERRGHWTYQCAVVVDDLRQGVDMIVRGDDLLASTGRQFLLRTLLGGGRQPLTLHHPLVTREDGAKLSKSAGDTGLADLRRAGWTPERVLGHAAWLGGLQHDARPLAADHLGRLWEQSRQHV